MNAEDATVPAAVAAAAPSIAAAVDAISDCLARGGRLDLRRRGLVGEDRGARRVGVRVDLLRPARNGRLARRRRRERATARTGGGRGRSRRRSSGRRRARRRAPTTSSSASARADARRTCSARSTRPPAAGARTACVVSAQGSELEQLVDHPIVVVVGPGVPRRVDPAQGGNRAEARSQHALDRLDDPARQDLRQPHGRRLGDEREAARTRPAHRADGDRRRHPSRSSDALSAADGDAKVAIVSLLAEIDSAEARARLDAAGAEHPTGAARMRLGVEAALVDGRLVRGDVELDRRAGRRLRLVVSERARHRRSGLRRPPGERIRRSRPVRGRRRRLPPGRRSAARDRRHVVPPDLHHRSRGGARRRPARSARRHRSGPASSALISKGRSSPRCASGSTPRPRAGIRTRSCSSACWTPGPVRLITLAPELAGADALIESPAATRDRRLVRALGRDCRRGERRVRRRSAHRDASLQRDAPVPASRSRHRRRRPRARRRGRPGHPRRRPPRTRDGDASSGAPPPVGSRSSRTRWPAPGSPTALTPRRPRDRDPRRRGARAERRARRKHAHDDRSRAEPPRPRRIASRRRSSPRPKCRLGSCG